MTVVALACMLDLVAVLVQTPLPQVVAAACLLLGAKAEETPKPLKEVVRVVCRVRFAHQPAELEAVTAPVRHCAASVLLLCTAGISICCEKRIYLTVSNAEGARSRA